MYVWGTAVCLNATNMVEGSLGGYDILSPATKGTSVGLEKFGNVRVIGL